LVRTEEQIGIDMMSNGKIIQYYALYCIYTATNQVPNIVTDAEGIVNIPPWIVASGWESNNIDPCSGQWFGVTCANDQVIKLDLFNNLKPVPFRLKYRSWLSMGLDRPVLAHFVVLM
jgi:hypothetical protein